MSRFREGKIKHSPKNTKIQYNFSTSVWFTAPNSLCGLQTYILHSKNPYFCGMRPKLKLNHIKSLHDARYCSAVGVELLGFRFGNDADDGLAPAAVAEIMEWLSGPESVGEFQYESPEEIGEVAQQAKLHWVAVPIDYPSASVGNLPEKLIFKAGHFDEDLVSTLQQLAVAFPGALFELPADPSKFAVWKALLETGLIGRCILAYEEPDPIYALLQKDGHKPFAFSLGDFVEEPDGLLDYETCDEFIDQFQALLPA